MKIALLKVKDIVKNVADAISRFRTGAKNVCNVPNVSKFANIVQLKKAR